MYPEDASISPDHHGHTPDRRYLPAAPYAASPSPVEGEFGHEPIDDRPPPPPVHRSTPTQTPPIMRKDVLRYEAHRQSLPANAYPGRPVYRAHESLPTLSHSHELYHGAVAQQFAAPRHHSYDVAYESHHRSLQPTVEDVPDSPGAGVDEFRRSGSYATKYSEVDRRQDPSPAPLNLSARNSSADIQQQHGGQRANPSPEHMQAELFLPSSDYSATNASQSSYDSYNQNSYAPYRQASELDNSQLVARGYDSSKRYDMPDIPAPLIPGADPTFSMEISQRLNEDRRHERRHTQPALPNSVRGRQMIEPPPCYSVPPLESSQTYTPPQHSYDNYDRVALVYSTRGHSPNPAMRDNSPGISPSGRHTIRRKSVSPAPPISDGRRLSGVPYGPDSYDALNPSVAAPLPKEQARQEKEYDEVEGKIITYDGKEIDPSDHLPMDTWAPEPEPKKPTGTTSSRTSLSGPLPNPSSGRKPLRIREARPNSSMGIPPATYITPEVSSSQLPPPSTGRNRLQKKANRNSAAPVMMSGANGPGPQTPLVPLAQQPQENFMPRPLGRASTVDYDKYALPMYDTSITPLHNGRDHSASAPPIPAKIPLHSGGVLVPMGRGTEYGGAGDMSLMEEMSRIDIGTGRARRHGHRSTVGGY